VWKVFAALAASVVAVAIAPSAFAGPSLVVGAVEDAGKQPDAALAQAQYDRAQQVGYQSVRITAWWTKGMVQPSATEVTALQNAAAAAASAGMTTVVAIHNMNSSNTPVTDTDRVNFAQFATAVVQALPAGTDVVVGNEPNLNYYWLPQFNADGTDAAAIAYEALLAQTYDAIKAVRPTDRVFGGALCPHGADNPTGTRPTHSPTAFIRDLGAAYRASGRTAPIMDGFSMHVYGDTNLVSPSMSHPNSTTITLGDYGKLVSLLGEAFDGTGQPGSTLPILYGEFGIETAIPGSKAAAYTGTETVTVADEARQADYYREAIKLAQCQPNVVGILFFHVTDESALSGWQSGPYYADGTPKSSFGAIRDAIAAERGGTLTACPDATPPTIALNAPAGGSTLHGQINLSATASDDVGVGRVTFYVNGAPVSTKYTPPTFSFTWSSGASGTYTIYAQAADAAGNVANSAPVTITVDNTAPETTITTAAPPTFAFGASETGATFECSLDGAAWAACTSPVSYGTPAVGSHTFQVRAADAFGNVDSTPAASTWTVLDTTPPETTIASAPSGTTPSISFTASEASTFECSLDGGSWAACSSPASYSVTDGTHTFQVRATDTAGNTDPTPASATWAVTSLKTASVSSVGYSRSSGYLYVTVTTNAPNATVGLRILRSGATYASGTVVTSSTGAATIRVSAAKGCYSTTITSLTAPGFAWNGKTPSNGACF
jgi:hypothetical protein